MNQVIYTKQTRTDGPWSAVGILLVFTLAAGFSAIGSRGETFAAKAVPIGVSAILFAVGIRGILLYLQKRAYSLVIGSELIEFGWVHKPRQQQTVKINEIAQIDWRSSKDDGRAEITLKNGESLWLPMHYANTKNSELRPVIEEHFPHIESID